MWTLCSSTKTPSPPWVASCWMIYFPSSSSLKKKKVIQLGTIPYDQHYNKLLSLSAAALGAWKIIIISYRRTCLVFNLSNLTYCLSQSQAYNSQDFSSHYFCQNTNQQNCPLVPTQKFTSRTSMSHQTDSGNLNKVWGVHPQCYIHCISLFEMQPICQAFWS